jgi:V/A-type H+-transporting ATPase subunit D
MATLALNKTSLHKEGEKLKTFQRFLPTLDLKRKQLLMERARAAAELTNIEAQLAELEGIVGTQLPMVSNEQVVLSKLVVVTDVQLAEENVVGAHLPVLKSFECQTRPYGYLVRPHWVDNVVVLLRQVLELEIQIQVARRRYELLAVAARKITQRVNLFEKVLIPRTKQNIKRIRLFLSDAERISVVQAKIAKRKRLAEETAA